jgi:predicted transcriptional regulator
VEPTPFVRVNSSLAKSQTSFTESALRVYLALACYRNKVTGIAFPRVTRIAEEMGLTDRAFRLGLKQLKAVGLVEVTRVKLKRGGYANQYKLP